MKRFKDYGVKPNDYVSFECKILDLNGKTSWCVVTIERYHFYYLHVRIIGDSLPVINCRVGSNECLSDYVNLI